MAMLDFQLWLHSLHGTPQRGLRPLRITHMQDAETMDDRLGLLEEAAIAGADQLTTGTASLTEVLYNDLGLYALNQTAERCLWLPLPLCQVVESTELKNAANADLDGIVGVVAYAHPIQSDALSWGQGKTALESAGEFGPSDIWLLVVSRRTDRVQKDDAPAIRVLESAVEALGVRGAIRSSFAGLEFVDQTFGEGSFATVKVMRRRWIPSSRNRTKCSASSSSTDPTVPSETDDEEEPQKFAAKVIVPTATETDVLVESSYFLAVQGHPNIVKYYGLFCESQENQAPVWTMVMEMHERGNLKDKIREEGPMGDLQCLKITADLLSALVHIHELGIIHRDLKPENVLLALDGSAVLADFGVSVHVSESVKMLVRCGSPGSIAPEILRKCRYGPKSDVFSCGTVLYYILSGIMPFLGSDLLSTLRSNARARVRFPADYFQNVSLRSQDIVRLFVQVQPPRRPDSREALVTVLAASQNHVDVLLPGVATIEEDAAAVAPPQRLDSDLEEGAPLPPSEAPRPLHLDLPLKRGEPMSSNQFGSTSTVAASQDTPMMRHSFELMPEGEGGLMADTFCSTDSRASECSDMLGSPSSRSSKFNRVYKMFRSAITRTTTSEDGDVVERKGQRKPSINADITAKMSSLFMGSSLQQCSSDECKDECKNDVLSD
eukprot:TRINITY_DN26794_c0_g2_i1.p1 TRINITY_DN26794_c0_g2~~TRINITY_DN26794_c0_g2_i1.p1  ORF type:complete len:680 (-),score=97.21 TRINITY_DN26794_c0_g2_i1:288-2279(-)